MMMMYHRWLLADAFRATYTYLLTYLLTAACSGERPYRCDSCGSCFSTKGNLKVHVSGHYNYNNNNIRKFPRPPFTTQSISLSVTAPTLCSSTLPTLPSRYSDPPRGDCCGQVLPQSTTSTSAAQSSSQRHCRSDGKQTSASSSKSAKSCRQENNDSAPSISVPDVDEDKTLNERRVTTVSQSCLLYTSPSPRD